MSVASKICGLSTPDTVAAAIAGGARFVGFVFFPPSPRNLSPAQAAPLIRGVPVGVTRVGVFVDPDDDLLKRVLAAAPLDLVQLHGDETPERVAQIKQRFGKKTMKAIKVAGESDLDAAPRYYGVADWLMFDARPPKAATRPGGNALAFDWELVRARQWPLPWMLSGGLTPANVAEAVRIARATVVDVSSGVESAPGVKDVAKIGAFLAAVSAL
ncbi:MAG: phosphoribosylanthranilate isomerase [Alphaproteobacteria bacterium]|nr:phosphoribosylanthranilate isomerase [Alphaproteobacteria bacterium]